MVVVCFLGTVTMVFVYLFVDVLFIKEKKRSCDELVTSHKKLERHKWISIYCLFSFGWFRFFEQKKTKLPSKEKKERPFFDFSTKLLTRVHVSHGNQEPVSYQHYTQPEIKQSTNYQNVSSQIYFFFSSTKVEGSFFFLFSLQ